jgi:hypothetical protein
MAFTNTRKMKKTARQTERLIADFPKRVRLALFFACLSFFSPTYAKDHKSSGVLLVDSRVLTPLSVFVPEVSVSNSTVEKTASIIQKALNNIADHGEELPGREAGGIKLWVEDKCRNRAFTYDQKDTTFLQVLIDLARKCDLTIRIEGKTVQITSAH